MPTLLFESVLPYTFSPRWLPDIPPFASKVEFKSHRLIGHLWWARELSGLLSGLREFRLLLECPNGCISISWSGGHSLGSSRELHIRDIFQRRS
jgi:hypothetical protein